MGVHPSGVRAKPPHFIPISLGFEPFGFPGNLGIGEKLFFDFGAVALRDCPGERAGGVAGRDPRRARSDRVARLPGADRLRPDAQNSF